jgi:hypothetical protein
MKKARENMTVEELHEKRLEVLDTIRELHTTVHLEEQSMVILKKVIQSVGNLIQLNRRELISDYDDLLDGNLTTLVRHYNRQRHHNRVCVRELGETLKAAKVAVKELSREISYLERELP